MVAVLVAYTLNVVGDKSTSLVAPAHCTDDEPIAAYYSGALHIHECTL